MAEKIDKNDCSICLSYFTKPKIIDCHHTFCTACLDDYVKRTAKKNRFPCPLCTRSINIPNGGIHDFPVNIYIEEKSVPVSVCTQHKKEKDVYCKDCKITLCYKCFITSHQGHNVQAIEDVESEHKLILKELEQKVQIKMTSNKSIVESLKKEVLTIKQCSAEECKKVDQRISAMYQILKDEGSRIKWEIQNSNLKQAQVMSDMTKDVEENTRQMSAFGKQIREVLNRRQLEEFLNITPKVRQAISDTNMVLFTVPNYECTHFQDGVVCNKKLSKLIGKVHNPEKNRYECSLDNNPAPGINKKAHKFAVNKDFLQDSDDDDVEDYECNPNISVVHFNWGGRNQFECSFDVIYGDQYSPFNEVLGNQDPLSQCYTIQGVVWRVECVLMSRFKPRYPRNRYVKLQLHSPGVKCRAIFKLKIININDSVSLINEGEHFFSNNGKDNLLSGNSVSHPVTRKTISGQKEDIWNYFRANISYPGSDSMKKTISEQTGNIRKHSTKMGQYTLRKAPSQDDNYVPFRACDSMEDSYVWDQLESDYILSPRRGFINSNNQITIQVIFSSIDYED